MSCWRTAGNHSPTTRFPGGWSSRRASCPRAAPARSSSGCCGSDSGNIRNGPSADGVYKFIELVGTSSESWEKAAAAAVNQASQSVRDVRVGEIVQFDVTIENGKIKSYRAKVKLSF